jgi:tRNA/tmRNA/rRNA uracil-C5-methylase (TrmA/RlmC/RlmD family)
MGSPPLSNKQLRAQVVNLARSGEATTPRCQHAPPLGECGGCTFQAVAYGDQVRAKHAALRDLWGALLPSGQLDQIGFVASPDPFEYRTRMDYVASKGRFGLRRGGKFNYIVDLHECHLIPRTAFAAARAAYERAIERGLPDYNLRSHEGFLRYIVVRRSPQDSLLLAFVTVAPDAAGHYEAVLSDVAETVLASFPAVTGISWLINDSLTDISFGRPQRHWGSDQLAMAVGERTLVIGPNTFFQNNVHLLLPLLDDVKGSISREVAPPLDPPPDDVKGSISRGEKPLLHPLPCDVKGSISREVAPPLDPPSEGVKGSISRGEKPLLHSLPCDVKGSISREVAPPLDPPSEGVKGSISRGEKPLLHSPPDREGIARAVPHPLDPPRVADLYGGVGTIALHIADAAARVVCVEAVEESASLARYNIAASGCTNVEAVHADVLPFLRAQPAGAFDVIVADPPRVGLGPEVCAELLRLAPRRLVYVSCNPLTQLDDARALMPAYRLTRLAGYDMFPQTPHLEALAVFEKEEGPGEGQTLP